MAEGEARGKALGEVTGRLQASRLAILDALEVRFGPISPQIAAHLETLADEESLRRAHRSALIEPSLEMFLGTLARSAD